MYETGIVALVGELADTDPAACDRDGLASLVAMSQRVRAWLDAFDVRVALHAARLAEHGSCDPASSLLTGGGRRSVREADAAARRAAVCSDLPKVHDALAGGRMSAGHVDAVARLAGELDDAARAELKDLQSAVVQSASVMPVETFEREMSKLGRVLSRDDGVSRMARLRQQRCVRRWIDRVSGMCHTHLQVDPETDARIASVLDAAVASARAAAQGEDVEFDHLKADALVGLITGARTTGHRIPDLTVLTDQKTMRDGPHDHTVCETGDGQPLPVETVHRLGCDATITPITLDDDGVPLQMGRTRRLATPEQRRALRAMYRSCGFPGCQVRFEDCRIHHVTWWEHLGSTNLDNLLPICERHHHHVHEGGWTLTLKPDRTITLRRPDGTLHHEGPTTTGTTNPEPRPPP
jgi:Domain of unknown function (DUF222)